MICQGSWEDRWRFIWLTKVTPSECEKWLRFTINLQVGPNLKGAQLVGSQVLWTRNNGDRIVATWTDRNERSCWIFGWATWLIVECRKSKIYVVSAWWMMLGSTENDVRVDVDVIESKANATYGSSLMILVDDESSSYVSIIWTSSDTSTFRVGRWKHW